MRKKSSAVPTYRVRTKDTSRLFLQSFRRWWRRTTSWWCFSSLSSLSSLSLSSLSLLGSSPIHCLPIMDKFNIGEIPRTSTGLIPSTVRRRIETLSTTKNWTTLPPKPSPELFPYRGDKINARNRKLAAERKAKKEAAMKRNAATKSSVSIEVSSTIANAPRTPRDSPTQGNVGWDANLKHNEFQLTPEEQRKQVGKT